MILTFTIAVLVAAGTVFLLHRDLRRAHQRRVARVRRWAVERALAESGIPRDLARLKETIGKSFTVAITANMADFQRAMEQASKSAAAFVKDLDASRCRWCQVLARIGLSHHAAHYRPRHKASRA